MKEGKPGNTREAQFGQSDKYQRIRDKKIKSYAHTIFLTGDKGVNMLKREKKSTEKKRKRQ